MALSGPSWAKVDALLDRALDMDRRERDAFLDRLSATEADRDVVARVRELVVGLDAGPGPLDRPVADLLGDDFLSHAQDEDALAVGHHVGPYRIEGELGRGGMGRVFAATRDDGEFTQEVALKILRWEFADGRTVERFKAERQLLANLDHPGIARLIDGGVTASGLPYLVMERVRGTTIDLYSAEHALSLVERLELVREVCRVVEYAHRNLVVHRDLKPSNIMITESGQVKLLDFGIAKLLESDAHLTQDDQAPLTPNYGAPEQILGRPITPATDVYALGVILHELLVGVRPHEVDRPSTAELARRVAEDDPTLPSVSGRSSAAPIPPRRLQGDLDSILVKALSRDPAQRYASAERLGEDLGRHLENRPVEAVQAGNAYRMGRFIRRNRVVVGAGGLLVLSLGFGLASTLIQADRAREESERARIEADRAATVASMFTNLFGLTDPFVTGGVIPSQDLLRRGVTDARARLTDDPATLASVLTALGMSLANLGEYGEAYPILAEAVELSREVGEPDLLAEALWSLGGLELGRRRYDAAGAVLEEALATQSDVGPGRRQALILASLGQQRYWVGQPEVALTLTDSAIALLSRWAPDDHRNRLRTVVLRGQVLRALGDAAGAAALYEQALVEARALLPATDRLIPATLNNLAFLRKQLGDLEGAEAAYRESLGLLENRVGPAHPDPVRVRTNLAAVVDEYPARTGEAEALLLTNVRLLRELGPTAVLRLERALTAATGAYLSWGMSTKAEAMARDAVELTESLPDGAPTIKRMHELRLALAIRAQGREQEADLLFQEATAALSQGGTMNSSGRGTLSWLATRYEAAGFPDAATRLRDLIVELSPPES